MSTQKMACDTGEETVYSFMSPGKQALQVGTIILGRHIKIAGLWVVKH